ncbi:sensor histidine kinase [Actinoplanes sp. CA-030573]|uniref:sensor histidine kinase n=1 Tax=Actinoplanes sp. CA-030573 TaxID=3239898 RepID=UPI003D910081
MGEVFRGVRARDWLLAGVLTALGAVLMYGNIAVTDAETARDVATGSMVHPIDGHSWWMLPVFLGATIPVLWWRRGVLTVTAVVLAVMVLHDLLFGWVTRCGAGLPVAFTLVFLGALAYRRTRAWVVCGFSAALVVAVLVVDATAGPPALPLALPVVLIIFGVGRAARHRSTLNQQLRDRDEELRQLRDERAALMVADDRARLSRQLDGMLQERLAELTAAAESAPGLPPAQARALLAEIESGSRRTMDDMREIVGLLRGGEVDLAPAPTVAHLDALLARHRSPGSRLTVSGDPRSLPAAVELSAYRIVEYVVTALADRPDEPVEVAVRFEDDALEIQVRGAVGRGADMKAAVARARERAKLLHGSVAVKVARGQARVVAQLPVPG